MSKALVIKGANFISNKVETISIENVVHCTGITLDYNSVTLTSLGAFQQIAATVLPANTTDEVVWASSNENCATVVDGVITCVGIGNATITAYCGEQSSTCSVNCSISYDAYLALSDNVGYYIYAPAEEEKDYVAVSTSTRRIMFCSETNEMDGYKAFSNASGVGSGGYPIPLPLGVSTIVITTDKTYDNSQQGSNLFLLDASNKCSYDQTLNCAKKKSAVIYPTVTTVGTVRTFTFDIDGATKESGYNSFVFTLMAVNAESYTEQAVISFA